MRDYELVTRDGRQAR